MRGQGRSVAVLNVEPLKMTCAMGWPDVQGQAHIHASVQGNHSGLEEGLFLNPGEITPLIRRLFKRAQSESATRADGVYVSVPAEYTQVYMRHVELPVRGQITEADMAELESIAREAMMPPGYRLLQARAIAWQVDRDMIYRKPVGMRGGLLQGYYALTYGYEPYLTDMEALVDHAGIALRGFADVPGAMMRYASGKLNLLGSFVLLDCDELFSSVMVAQRGKIWMLRRTPAGLQRFCQDIMAAENVEYYQARAWLQEMVIQPQTAEDTLAVQAVRQRIYEVLDWAGRELAGASISLQDPIHLVLSGEGWTGIPGVEELLAQSLGAKITWITPPPKGASIHSMAMLDQVLAHGTRERSWWERITEKITQTKH